MMNTLLVKEMKGSANLKTYKFRKFGFIILILAVSTSPMYGCTSDNPATANNDNSSNIETTISDNNSISDSITEGNNEIANVSNDITVTSNTVPITSVVDNNQKIITETPKKSTETNANTTTNNTTTNNTATSIITSTNTGFTKSKSQLIIDENLRHEGVLADINTETRKEQVFYNDLYTSIKKMGTPYSASDADYEIELVAKKRVVTNIEAKLISMNNDETAGKERDILNDKLVNAEADLNSLITRYAVKKLLAEFDADKATFLNAQQDKIDAENKLYRKNLSDINNMN